MSILKELLESRDAAQKALEDFLAPLIEAKADLTEDQETRKAELTGAVDALDERIDEVDADEQRTAKLAEVRKRAGVDAQTHAKIVEPRVYEDGSPNSYFGDIVRASNIGFKGHGEALKRLNQHAYEVSVEVANRSKEGRRAENQLRESTRTENGTEARDALAEYRARGNAGAGSGREMRAADTTTNSGGSFVTPTYLVSEYAPYNEPGRSFIDQCNSQPLPDFGMTVFLPHVTGPTAVGTQVTQNGGIAEVDPTAGYLSASLTTEAGQVVVSQQLLDRAGPGFNYDKMVFDQLNRDYAPKVDTLAVTTALAGAGAVTYTDASGFTLTARTAPGTGGFYGQVSKAKSNIRTGAGVVMNPTHLFLNPTRWEFISGYADGNGRPTVVPDYAGAFNAIAAGNSDGDSGVEGNTGYRLNGLPVFQDLNIPNDSSARDQAIVGNLAEVWVFEGNLVPRVIPQTYASNLSVLLQVYAYIAVIGRYPTAVQAISGSGMSTMSFTG